MSKALSKIRYELSNKVGKRVQLTAFKSRNREENWTGILDQTYPSVFVLNVTSLESTSIRLSYLYTDILTGDIELTFV